MNTGKLEKRLDRKLKASIRTTNRTYETKQSTQVSMCISFYLKSGSSWNRSFNIRFSTIIDPLMASRWFRRIFYFFHLYLGYFFVTLYVFIHIKRISAIIFSTYSTKDFWLLIVFLAILHYHRLIVKLQLKHRQLGCQFIVEILNGALVTSYVNCNVTFKL